MACLTVTPGRCDPNTIGISLPIIGNPRLVKALGLACGKVGDLAVVDWYRGDESPRPTYACGTRPVYAASMDEYWAWRDWKEKYDMPSETRFAVTCGGAQHEIIISTVHIPDPDNPKSGKTIPAPHLEMPNHCTCPDREHCCGDSNVCSGQSWLEAQMVYIKLAEVAEPSCAQWCLEFMGTAPKRVEQSWWSIRGAEKAAAK